MTDQQNQQVIIFFLLRLKTGFSMTKNKIHSLLNLEFVELAEKNNQKKKNHFSHAI